MALACSHSTSLVAVCTCVFAVWELLTRDRPFKGLLEGDLVVGVCDRGLRPVFPPGCPASYVTLAQQCWSEDPSQRPTAAQVGLSWQLVHQSPGAWRNLATADCMGLCMLHIVLRKAFHICAVQLECVADPMQNPLAAAQA